MDVAAVPDALAATFALIGSSQRFVERYFDGLINLVNHPFTLMMISSIIIITTGNHTFTNFVAINAQMFNKKSRMMNTNFINETTFKPTEEVCFHKVFQDTMERLGPSGGRGHRCVSCR